MLAKEMRLEARARRRRAEHSGAFCIVAYCGVVVVGSPCFLWQVQRQRAPFVQQWNAKAPFGVVTPMHVVDCDSLDAEGGWKQGQGAPRRRTDIAARRDSGEKPGLNPRGL